MSNWSVFYSELGQISNRLFLLLILTEDTDFCLYITNHVHLFLRLEQPYLNANASFFEALSCCSRLQRVCLISRCGTFDPSATETFMERCCHVVMCHMFMGGTLVACRTLQKALLDRLVTMFMDLKLEGIICQKFYL